MRNINFRARRVVNGKYEFFYRNNQYLISFLRRATSFIMFGDHKEKKEKVDVFNGGIHESYIEKRLEEYLDDYTSFDDVNEKNIFNGDILSFTVFDCFDNDTQYIGVVKFAEGEYQIWKTLESEYYGSDGAFHLGWVHSQDCELKIIGNIYANLKLLNNQK